MSKYTVQTEVDVDLDEFDTEDLIEYLEGQGYTVTKTMAPGDAWMQVYDALRYKPDPLPIVRQIVCDATGRIL